MTSAPDRADELTALLQECRWFTEVLDAIAQVDPPDWWIGAGAVRDVVWDTRFGDGFDAGQLHDVDVAFFDPSDLRPERDADVEVALCAVRDDVPWEAKNQAAVHLWYPRRFGVDVEAFGSIHEAVASWPETAAAVAVRLARNGSLDVCAPLGLDDLLDGVWRRNPTRVTEQEYLRRLTAKRPRDRWPAVRVYE
ncbi:MAG: hypothetical protein JWP02_2135 [Acidimicrobiales bacterium]|nr:hypothetical protein [Acidimicrobiales bacterium]